MSTPTNFTVWYQEKELQVQLVRTGKQVLYRVLSADQQLAFFLTRAQDAEGSFFWTSIPEGRQQLAEEIGVLIEAYLLS